MIADRSCWDSVSKVSGYHEIKTRLGFEGWSGIMCFDDVEREGVTSFPAYVIFVEIIHVRGAAVEGESRGYLEFNS